MTGTAASQAKLACNQETEMQPSKLTETEKQDQQQTATHPTPVILNTFFESPAFGDFDPNESLCFRRWLRVKVSGQGPPKPSPAAEAQRFHP